MIAADTEQERFYLSRFGSNKTTLDMKQRGRITLETEDTIILHEGSMAQKLFCRECDASVLMVAPRAAAAVSGVTEREVFRLVESGRIHFTEDEPIRVCLISVHSLLNEIQPSDNDVKVDLPSRERIDR